MHDPPARRHELQIPRANGALVSGEVLVVHPARQEVGDCFLAAVGVVGEAGAGLNGEVVEHEEGGEVAQLRGADGAADARAGAFGLLDCGEDFTDGAGGGHFGGLVLGGFWGGEVGLGGEVEQERGC